MGNCKSLTNPPLPSSPTNSLSTEPVLSGEKRELIMKAVICFLSARDAEWLLHETGTGVLEGFKDRLLEYLKTTGREERVFVVETSFQ